MSSLLGGNMKKVEILRFLTAERLFMLKHLVKSVFVVPHAHQHNQKDPVVSGHSI